MTATIAITLPGSIATTIIRIPRNSSFRRTDGKKQKGEPGGSPF